MLTRFPREIRISWIDTALVRLLRLQGAQEKA
jgi:hypothetical protein